MSAFRRLGALLLVALTLLLPNAGSRAQAIEGISVRITSLDSAEFPRLSLFLDVFDADGWRIRDLNEEEITVREDDVPLAGASLHTIETGTRQIFIINTTLALKRRDVLARTEFDYIRQALIQYWAQPEVAIYGLDDLSLLTTDGALALHATSAAQLASALDNATPTYDQTLADFNLLLHALDIAADPAMRTGMPRHAIFISGPITLPSEETLTNAIALAQQNNISVDVVFIRPPQTTPQTGISQLQQIARATGGTFSYFDKQQGIPALGALLLAERSPYQLQADSLATASGEHTIQVLINRGEVEALSNVMTYQAEILPPQVTFVQPPATIARQAEDPSHPMESLAPTSQAFALLITFPDGFSRPIVESWLLADGIIVDRRLSPPFDALDWDLSQLLVSGQHTLQAGVQDTLGLEATSIEIAVQVQVPPAPQGLQALKPALPWLLGALAMLLLGIGLSVTLLHLGRQKASFVRAARPARPPKRVRLRQRRTSRRGAEPAIEAQLVPIGPDGEGGPPIPLTGASLTLGRNASLVTTPLVDPSVSSLHARIIRLADGEYIIRDQGSTSGTWVNYQPIPEDGQALQHGDLIHLGRVAFRFRLLGAPPQRDVVFTPTNREGQVLEDGHPPSDA
jgi:hypothetical protein